MVPFKVAPIGFAIGWLLIILGSCCSIPLYLTLYVDESSLGPFGITGLSAMGVGGVLIFFLRRPFQLYIRQAFLLTIISWCVISLFAALPFYLSSHHPIPFLDAIFDAVSSLTTTGFSLLENQIPYSEALRFWRIFLQWSGGFGIMLMAMALLPSFKIGGTQLVVSEFSDQSEKIMPRTSHIALGLLGIYLLMTAVVALLLTFGNLPLDEALYYSMSSLSTGGIVIGGHPVVSLSPYCKCILMGAMVLGGSTLLVIFSAIYGYKSVKDDQIEGYGKSLLVICLLTLIWGRPHLGTIDSFFLAISAVTTTGFSMGTPCGGFLSLLFLVGSYVGGCGGSTAGGIKLFRLQILYRITKYHLFRALKPYGFFFTIYNQSIVSNDTFIQVISVVFFYIAGWLLLALCFSFIGHDPSDSLPLAASLISNSGLILCPLADHIQQLTTAGKWFSILGMLCGRFEFVTLLAVLIMPFWRR